MGGPYVTGVSVTLGKDSIVYNQIAKVTCESNSDPTSASATTSFKCGENGAMSLTPNLKCRPRKCGTCCRAVLQGYQVQSLCSHTKKGKRARGCGRRWVGSGDGVGGFRVGGCVLCVFMRLLLRCHCAECSTDADGVLASRFHIFSTISLSLFLSSFFFCSFSPPPPIN